MKGETAGFILKTWVYICREVDMLKHAFQALAVLLFVSVMVFFPATAAWAADLRQGDTEVIASGDVVNDDLYVGSSLLVINGTVNGDVYWAGQTLKINGKVNGSVTAVGMDINIDGDVSGSVRAAGSTINIRGNIGTDLMVAGMTVDMTHTATIGRDLVFAASKINIDSTIKNSIRGKGTDLTLNGIVGSDVKVSVNKLTIGSTADIKGNIIYTGKNEIVIQSGALIGGAKTHNLPEAAKTAWPPLGVWGTIILFMMALLTGIVLIVIFPKRAKSVVAAIKYKPLPTLGWGALVFIATPIAVVITCITVIGIPVGLISLFLYGMAIYISQVVIGLFIGYWIVGRSGKFDSRGILIAAFALGLIVLSLLNLIPYIGPILFLATAIFGLGAMFVSEKTRRRSETVEGAGDQLGVRQHLVGIKNPAKGE